MKWEKLHLEEVIPEWSYVMGKVILGRRNIWKSYALEEVTPWDELHPRKNYTLGGVIKWEKLHLRRVTPEKSYT